jgi:N6-adenosine-specific RNA methylase IME4
VTEGLYLAGFTFERAMAHVLVLLKSGGWMKVGAGYTDVNDFVRGLKLDRFKVIADQRREFVDRVKELQPEVSHRAIADALGVAHTTISRGAGADAPPDDREARQNGKAAGANAPPGADAGRRDARRIVQRSEWEERREEKLATMGAAAALAGLFSILYGDPPWKDDFGMSSRGVENHYPVMDLEEIKALPVAKISAPDAVLYLWALPHMLHKALDVMTAWGFEYRTQMVWGKDEIGSGQWCRNQHELLLIGRRGKFPPPPESVRSPSLIMAPVGEHSAKPDIFAEMIERWYPDAPKIELFRRGPARPGWDAWGNEARAAAE